MAVRREGGVVVATHAPPGYDCPFCRYVAGGSNDLVGPEHIVESADETLAFVSPRAFGRCHGLLVIPKAHHENLYTIPDELGGPMLRATRRMALALKAADRCEGTSTRQHNEPAGNQDLWHFHVHVFPRWHGDRLYDIAQATPVDRTAMADRAASLRAALARLDG